MAELVAIDLPGGDAFVDALRGVWDRGDAAAVLDRRAPRPARTEALDVLAPSAVIDTEGTHARPGGRAVTEGDALVVLTSGTSGQPRGVVLTHQAIAAAAAATSSRLAVDPTSDRWLCCLPLSHLGGLSVVTRALLTGTALEVHDGFDAAAFATAAARGATLTSLVPTALRRVDVSSFRVVLVGGSAPPSRLPANATLTYGLTESCGGVVYDGVPLEGVEVRVVDDEIHLRGPMLLRCYRDGTDPKDADGWLPTGDLGRLTGAGHLVVEGRRDDLIVSGGESIWPAAVEAALSAHPEVADVAVAGAPDEEWGQIVVAHVVPADADRPPDLDSLRDAVRKVLPAHAAPRRLVLVGAIRRTTLGKVRRRAL